MSEIPSKVMIFNVDAAIAPRVYEWAGSGLLPAMGQLMARGVYAGNCLACYPTVTMTNRASIATGSWPGTHGIVDSVVPGKEMEGEPLLLDLDNLMAETLWRAGKRGGRKSLILHWSCPWNQSGSGESEPDSAKSESNPDALVDMISKQLAQSVSDAKKALAEPWDICFVSLDLLDGFYQLQGGQAERKPKGKGSSKTDDIELALYQRIDRALGELLEVVGNDTLFAAVSAHGVKPKGSVVDVGNILNKAGLLVYAPAAGGESPKVDWNRTKAAPWGTAHITVNLKGRNFNGIVEPGEECEEVVQKIIDTLHDYTDPDTGLKPINLAFRAEDMRILGLYGELIGDVIYSLDPRFGPEFGAQLPASSVHGGDMRGFFIMAGPGVKSGEALTRNVWLTDVVPTVCYLAELPIPKSAEGCVIYQALENPDDKADELELLRGELSRLKLIVERPGMMC